MNPLSFLILAAVVIGAVKKRKKGEKKKDLSHAFSPVPLTAEEESTEGVSLTNGTPEEPEHCPYPHGSIPDEVHEGIDPCHDDMEPVVNAAAAMEPADEESCAITAQDAMRGMVIAEILGRPGGRRAGNLG